MTTENIDIKIREDGSRVVKRNLEDIDGSARKAATGVDYLKRILAGLGGALAVREVIQLVDTFTTLQNRLRSTGLEGQNLTGVYQALLKVSNDTRSSVEGSVELYSRLAVSSKELGVSQSQLIDFTKSLNQAIILSGASAQEAQAGIIQLSQGIASGTLRGDELRSVLEQLPAVADVIAKSLGVTRGQLRKLGEDGKITANVVLDAFKKAREELDGRFAKTVPTISQSFQVLKNQVISLAGAYDEATGLSTALSKSLLFLSENLDTVIRSVLALVSGLVLVAGTAAGLRGATAAVQALTAAITANPLGALLVVLVTVISTLTLFRDKIQLGTDALTTLGDFMRAAGEVAATAFNAIYDYAAAALEPLVAFFKDKFGDINITVLGVIQFAAKVVDTFIGLWRGAVRATVAIFEGVPPALSDIFAQALNFVLEKISQFVNKAGELLNTVTEFAGLGKIASTVDFTLDNKDAGAAKRLGQDIAGAFSSGFNESNPAQDLVASLAKRAAEIGAERRAAIKPGTVSTTATTAAKLPVDQKEIDKATNALRSLLNTIQPSSGAVLELAKAQETLNNAQAKGLITGEQNQKYLALARRYYQDIIDPLGKINRELDQQTALLGFNIHEREVEAQLQSITQDLQRQGIDLTTTESGALRVKLQAMRDLNAVTQAQDDIYAQSIGKRREFETQLAALQATLANPQSGFSQGDGATATVDLLKKAGLDPEGTQVAMDAQVAAFQAMYDKIDLLRQKNVISEQTAQQLQAKVAIEANTQRLQNTSTFFGNLATLSQSGNKKVAAIGKAAAVAQATIDGVVAVQKALASAPPPYNYALALAVGVAAAANVAQIAGVGFKDGGYTGNGGTGDVAGVVHGKEFVVNAEATKRNRAALEAMNSGQAMSGGGGGGTVVSIAVNNNAPNTKASAQEKETPTGREIEITIEQVVIKQVRNGGGIANAMETQYGLNRAAGTVR